MKEKRQDDVIIHKVPTGRSDKNWIVRVISETLGIMA